MRDAACVVLGVIRAAKFVVVATVGGVFDTRVSALTGGVFVAQPNGDVLALVVLMDSVVAVAWVW